MSLISAFVWRSPIRTTSKWPLSACLRGSSAFSRTGTLSLSSHSTTRCAARSVTTNCTVAHRSFSTHERPGETEKARSEREKHSRVTQDQISFFLDRGYLVLDEFWDATELTAIRKQLEHLQSAGRLANVATAGDGKTHTEVPKNLQLCPLSPEADLFRSLPFSPKVAATLADLLLPDAENSNALLCYLSQVFWKPAHHGIGTSWHQDNAYFKVKDCQHATAMWTAVHDATKENGALEVIPAAWKQGGLPHHRDGNSDHHITCRDSVDETIAVSLEVQAGGVIFFNYLTPHCTRGNATDQPRAGIAYHFLPAASYRERQFPLPDDAEYVAPLIWDSAGIGRGKKEYGCIQDFDRDVHHVLTQ
ncbi:phytanoyl-CoA dioxygenase domain-containing protein 1-like [Sycon ciliatum]|uniref:phytanoyl-CoA dioxygenase domain-containing protein 1-like n=1 Tax=Sycon ciliatum TaxID=27933 RepID=UPI0031F6474D|eukprot:scpid81465/ scgid26956/ Probable phytanoyl-CoA dioxygenase; Phytanic acid oxidase; Phytanoyl-CoA alpha-hydroxylase